MTQVLQVVINGILLGGIYALLGVGMTMMFGIVKLTNLAHGEFVIIGAYASTLLAQAMGVDPILTLVITIPLMFLIGMGLQSGLINRVMMIGSEPALLVTFGISSSLPMRCCCSSQLMLRGQKFLITQHPSGSAKVFPFRSLTLSYSASVC